MHITEKQYTTVHKTKHIQYTVFPAMPMVAQLIKIFHTILWKVRFITKFIQMSLKALLKHEQSKSILIQFLKIHFNITLLHSHRPSEWTLSFHFPINNLLHITSHFDTPVSDKHYKLSNSTLCILLLPFCL